MQRRLPKISKKDYEKALNKLWIELVRLQRHVIEKGERLLIIIEGRDAAGKDGTIKRITRHMSPRETRVFAPSKPSDREQDSWYFQRFVPHLPAGGEIVIFNRSWYNRAGVEPVMGFCTPEQTRIFLEEVPRFERMLVREGIQIRKFYLDIERKVQEERMQERRKDPLKQWKISPVDERACELWEDYTRARDHMLVRTSTSDAPWTVVAADHKRTARIHLIRSLLHSLDYGKKGKIGPVSEDIAFGFESEKLHDGSIST